MELETNILSLTFKVYNDLIYVAGGCQDGSLVCTIIKTIKVKNKIKSYENTLISKSNIFYPISSLVFFIHLDEINLLVTTAVNLGLIYKNLNLNLSSPVHLTLPFDGDSILCATLADIDLDGVKEILLGTYNQLLLVYKLENERYVLAWQKRLPYPIYGIIESDFDGDGLKELVILTMYGLHVMKPNLNTAKKRILSYLHYIHKNFELTKP
ncbi:hypothetical protein K502DRAFT_1606 [Neoconidiobolus thromboides FSU 785]|nr:hypothetical protein K502DRAFT_1606 [Neoconidiobolus thromboides FSU 785]